MWTPRGHGVIVGLITGSKNGESPTTSLKECGADFQIREHIADGQDQIECVQLN